MYTGDKLKKAYRVFIAVLIQSYHHIILGARLKQKLKKKFKLEQDKWDFDYFVSIFLKCFLSCLLT